MSRKQDKNIEEIKKKNRELNEPPQLTIGEEVGNAITHGIGAMLAIVGLVLLLVKSDTGLKIMASCFYGISLFILMIMSSLYHAFKSGSKVKRLWRRFDYLSIYLLIGGTFAPLYLVYWGNTLGIVLFCVQWLLIIIGISLISIFGPGKFRAIHFTLYFVIGWSAVIFFPQWIKNDLMLFLAILLGGIIYTVGMIPFQKNRKYDHFKWHFFVLVGAIIHWFAIYLFVY